MDVRDVIKKLGRRRVMDALGVSTSQVSNRLKEGKFPGHWYGPIDGLAEADGWTVPKDLFSWKQRDAA